MGRTGKPCWRGQDSANSWCPGGELGPLMQLQQLRTLGQVSSEHQSLYLSDGGDGGSNILGCGEDSSRCCTNAQRTGPALPGHAPQLLF